MDGIGIGSPGGRGYRAPYGANNMLTMYLFQMRKKIQQKLEPVAPLVSEPG